MKFKKRPVVIEAVRVTAADFNGMSWDSSPFTDCPQWLIDAVKDGTVKVDGGRDADYAIFQIHTLEGVMTVEPGDWIIQGVKGELYPCKPDIFDMTYEAI